MSEIKNCPFYLVDVVSDQEMWKGSANLIHTESKIPLALVHRKFVPELRELLNAWNTRPASPRAGREEMERLIAEYHRSEVKLDIALNNPKYTPLVIEAKNERNEARNRILDLACGKEE